MSYASGNEEWQNKQVITADSLNNIEQKLTEVANKQTILNINLSKLNFTVPSDTRKLTLTKELPITITENTIIYLILVGNFGSGVGSDNDNNPIYKIVPGKNFYINKYDNRFAYLTCPLQEQNIQFTIDYTNTTRTLPTNFLKACYSTDGGNIDSAYLLILDGIDDTWIAE